LTAIRKAAAALGERINEGRALVSRIEISTLPEEARRWFLTQRLQYSAHIDNLEGDLRTVLASVHGYDTTALDALDAEFDAAHKVAGIIL